MAEQKDPPEDHHYLPRFYLGAWVQPPENLLYRYYRHPRAKKLTEKQVGTKGVGREMDLYTKMTSGEPSYEIESEFFGEIDREAALALDVIRDESRANLAMSDAQRRAWSTFLVSLPNRHPVRLNETMMFWVEKYKEGLARAGKTSFSEAEAFLLVERSRNHALELMQARINEPYNRERIEALPWAVVPFERGVVLTSDRPLIFQVEKLPREQQFFVIGISPGLVFVASGGSNHEQLAEEYNHRLFSQKPEWVGSHRKLDPEQLLLTNFYLGKPWTWDPPGEPSA